MPLLDAPLPLKEFKELTRYTINLGHLRIRLYTIVITNIVWYILQ